MELRVLENISPASFDALAPHPLQSYAWGEARKKNCAGVVRFGWFEGNTMTAVFQMTLHRIPHTKFFVGFIPKSGLIDEEVLNEFYAYAKENNIIFIKFEIGKGDAAIDLKYDRLVKSSHPHFSPWTQIVDLQKSEQELLAGFDARTRYNINFAKRKGVIIKEMSNDAGFEIFSKLFFETCKRQKYQGHTKSYHRAIWDAMSGAGIAHIFVAFLGDEPLAAIELFVFKNKLYYPYGGSSDMHKNVKAMNLIIWEAIRFGKDGGAETFDLWGSLPEGYDKNDPWAGFSDFKKGYGTRFVESTVSYDLVANLFLYKLYTWAFYLKKKLT